MREYKMRQISGGHTHAPWCLRHTWIGDCKLRLRQPQWQSRMNRHLGASSPSFGLWWMFELPMALREGCKKLVLPSKHLVPQSVLLRHEKIAGTGWDRKEANSKGEFQDVSKHQKIYRVVRVLSKCPRKHCIFQRCSCLGIWPTQLTDFQVLLTRNS